MLPRLWFKHFGSTSLAARNSEGELVGFLVGYVPPGEGVKAYVHFIGVDPRTRGHGVGRSLYQEFQERVTRAGSFSIEAVTSPINRGLLAFHQALGFLAVEPDGSVVPPLEAAGHQDYDGAGEHRVLLQMTTE